MNLKAKVKEQIIILESTLTKGEITQGRKMYGDERCTLLSQAGTRFEFTVDHGTRNERNCVLAIVNDEWEISQLGSYTTWNDIGYACLLVIKDELDALNPKGFDEHKRYTREGMKKRVLEERRLRTAKVDYRIKWASNIHGDHILTNEKGVSYRIFLRDFNNETGYSDSEDAKLNKLGTTKHIMFTFDALKKDKNLYGRLSKEYPFIEIFCDPLNDYKISWYYPNDMGDEEKALIIKYFGNGQFIDDGATESFISFLEEAKSFENIRIRPEVSELVESLYDEQLLSQLAANASLDFSAIRADLFDYQKEGVAFVLFRKAAILADEMGLGKTLQAITVAVLKKQIFGFSKALIVCPASLKSQWKKEIEKFSDERVLIVDGTPQQRERLYNDRETYFLIVNYETILRDASAINRAGLDFLILDEAQRVKNFETKTASAVKRLNSKHTLVITGTPIENKLIDIFSIMSFLNPRFFGPLWEFSYQHCLFDPERKDKINGYYNLSTLNEKLKQVVIRRQKRHVLEQLPNVRQIEIPVELSPLQQEMHGSFASSLTMTLRKPFLTPFDLQRIQLLLANMRMVCDSTYLIDDQTNESPKLLELEYMLLEKLDIQNNSVKLIIFSEWRKVHKLIGEMLRKYDIGFVELSGKIPVKQRGDLIKKFESDPRIKVFLSTEAGGSGLNLQVADTLINFELPWNPAKKNQRIGRIDRLGQKSNKLTIYNFITRKSIEESIAAGLLLKQNLFEGVLDKSSNMDFVDFSQKGKSQFIAQLEEMLGQLELVSEAALESADALEPSIMKPADIEADHLATTEAESSPKVLQMEIDFSEEGHEETEEEPVSQEVGGSQEQKAREMEQVMNNGMQFLAGLFKMSTGKDMGIESQKIEVNKETGEVTMKFKLPGF
jgi:SNF2 family DNA or RNA helicase